ncbi:MAG: hypothetical protein CSA52_00665 [Gammaproteobacteria bacterium]|nr:MAG: hypothetical protein CSB48_08385 [Pseudomonadota bacterium]PIE38818.1 MAG: hypothetical protein CSA52_00665 [Gammaproteobacteria bacterium]
MTCNPQYAAFMYYTCYTAFACSGLPEISNSAEKNTIDCLKLTKIVKRRKKTGDNSLRNNHRKSTHFAIV